MFVMFAFFAFHKFAKFGSKKIKAYFRDGIVALCVAIFGLGLSIYYSEDLIYKDFITAEGTLIDYARDNDVRKLEFLADGEIITVKMLQSDYAKLSPNVGECFKFTYAIRTNIVLSIEPIHSFRNVD